MNGIDLQQLLYSILCFTTGNILVWFQVSFIKAFPDYSDYAFLVAIILGIPVAITFYYGWLFGYNAVDSWWSIRFIGFSLTFIIFPFMTYYFLGESLFNLKHLICTFLSVLIVVTQIILPDNDVSISRSFNEDGDTK